MASTQDFVEYVCEQIDRAGRITYKKMFGEYAIYCDLKVVALVCDDRLFIKQTAAGRAAMLQGSCDANNNFVEAPPYQGAKPYFLIEDRLEDREWLSNLISITTNELPLPKAKSPKTNKSKSQPI